MRKKVTRTLTSAIDLNFYPRSKRSQEEMVGFALIVVMVAVILMMFISFSLKAPEQEAIESYELENFIQSVLNYNVDYDIEVSDLIKNCNNYDEDCELMKTELENILEESWIVEEDSVIKGYNLKIVDKDKEIFSAEKGEITQNYKTLPELLSDAEIIFIVYY